jgi:hypothetical protein
MIKKVLLFTSIVFLFSCVSTETKDVEEELSQEEKFINSIEDAHNYESYNSKEVIQFDLNLVFGGKKRFEGTIQMTPSGGLVKMIDSSKTLVWDGNEAYSSDTSYTGGRFGLLTWSYFFAAPYKLGDPGSQMKVLGSRNLNDLPYESGKLTFGEGVGDTPDDWYVVYKDEKSNLLAAMAYIVTASSSVKEAEADPHAITYEAYDLVYGIPFATQWNFWTWNEVGELNKLLGSASISKIQFRNMEEDMFTLK